jgi:porin
MGPLRGQRVTKIARTFLVGLGLLAAPSAAIAQAVDIPETWGGDIWSRPRLTGDWGGLRDDMGKKGIVLDVDTSLTPQSVMSGGRDHDTEFWGNTDVTLNMDSQRLGLWPGAFLNISSDTSFGSSVLRQSGAIVPVNTAAILPVVNQPTSALMNATFTQFLSPKFGLFAGKIDTLNLGAGEFYGDWRTQFQNTALVFPMVYGFVPISAFGGGVVALPWEGVTLSIMALDADGTPTNDNLGHAFSNGATLYAGGNVTIQPFGLVGHQSLGATWSNADRTALDQDPTNIVRGLLNARFPRLADPGPVLTQIFQRFFPALLVPVQPLTQKNTSWAFSYGFDQYFWQPDNDPKRGIGLFFSFGTSDGEVNPIKYSYSAGIGGKGVVPGRPLDSFGIGVAQTVFSDEFVPFLRQQLNLGLNRENALEMYYNAGLTPWLNASVNLQIIDPALKRTLSSSGQLVNVDTAVVGGVRLNIRL